MVVFLLLLYSNYPHTSKENEISLLYLLVLLYLFSLILGLYFPIFFFGKFGYIHEWVDYYKFLEKESLNDLTPLFYMYYFYYPNVLFLVGFFLFLLSVIYLYSTQLILETENIFYKKDNYTFGHVLKQPSFFKFKFYKNDL